MIYSYFRNVYATGAYISKLAATLNRDHLITALTSGIVIYGGCLIGALTKAPPILLLFTYVLPGLLFGMVLSMTNDMTNGKRNIIMTLISILVYSISVYVADIPNRLAFLNGPSKIVIASVTGAVLLSISYDLLINKEIQLMRSFINPIIIGIFASALSAYAAYQIDEIQYNQEGLEFLNQLGLYSIFPIWQVLFILNKDIRNSKSKYNEMVAWYKPKR